MPRLFIAISAESCLLGTSGHRGANSSASYTPPSFSLQKHEGSMRMWGGDADKRPPAAEHSVRAMSKAKRCNAISALALGNVKVLFVRIPSATQTSWTSPHRRHRPIFEEGREEKGREQDEAPKEWLQNSRWRSSRPCGRPRPPWRQAGQRSGRGILLQPGGSTRRPCPRRQVHANHPHPHADPCHC